MGRVRVEARIEGITSLDSVAWSGFPETDPEIQEQVVYLRGEINTN